MDISQTFTELRESGVDAEEAVRQIFREDYNADIKTLVEVTGFDGAHIGRLKGQVSRALGRKGAPPRGRVEDREMVPPLTLEFKAAIDDLLERSSERFREHLCILFERQADKLVRDRTAFENFLLRNGLTPVQANGVIERIMVTAGQQPSGQGFQTVSIPGVGYVVFQPSQPQGTAGQPIIVQSPGGALGKTAEEARAEAKLESRMERLEEKIGTFIEGGGKGGAREPLMRRGRRPLFDDDGNILKDASGEIIFEEFEEPWEPGSRDTVTETILPLLVKQAIGGKKEIDEEALVLKIKDKIAPGGEGKVTTEAIKDAVRSEMSDVRKDLDTLKKDQERRERQEEIDRAVGAATKEYKTIIDGLTAQLGERGGYKGLSDTQATMRYQKELVDTMVDAVSNQVASVREDIRPFILQQAVQSMKMQGMSDEIIGQFLNTVRQKIPATGAISESSKEAAVERIKQWSKT